MDNAKYTMIGMSSAGKTCYITAMYMKMSTGVDGFTLVTDDTTRAKLERDILSLRGRNGVDRFPQATNETTTRSYQFKMNYETNEILTFEMLDYAGGLLRSRGNAYAQIKKSIEESSALYIFIDGESFCDEDREERKENVYYDCAMTVTPIIQDFADAHKGNLPPIVFIVTKADLCKHYVSSQEITAVIKELFSPAFSKGTFSYICAVSLGDTISDDEYKGRFKPVNIHIPFFIGSYHKYFDQYLALKSYTERRKKEYTEEKHFAVSMMETEQKKWRLFRDESAIQAYRKNAECSENNLEIIQTHFDKIKELVVKFGAKLEAEGPNFKCFVNGVEQSQFRGFLL